MPPQNKDNTKIKVIAQSGNAKSQQTEPVSCYWIYFNLSAGEVHRVAKSTPKTFIQSINNIKKPTEDLKGWKEVPMPKIIIQRIQSKENTTGKKYQKYDYLIAARTGLFNLTKKNGKLQLYTDGAKIIPISESSKIPDLDPTYVKAVAMQESNIGQTKDDIMTVSNPLDYGEFKSKYGLTKNATVTPSESLYYGLRLIASKGFKGGIDYDPKTGVSTYTFQGWLRAAGWYNGFGIERVNKAPKPWTHPSLYENYVKQMIANARVAKPSDY